LSDKPQSLKNHARYDPMFHYAIIWIVILNFFFAVMYFIGHHSTQSEALIQGWLIVLALGLVLMALKSRLYSLKVQDRIIRLEEQVRLRTLGAPEATISKLNIDQLIALRFASDDEVVGLAARAVTDNMTRQQIKESITNWRTDNWRV